MQKLSTRNQVCRAQISITMEPHFVLKNPKIPDTLLNGFESAAYK